MTSAKSCGCDVCEVFEMCVDWRDMFVYGTFEMIQHKVHDLWELRETSTQICGTHVQLGCFFTHANQLRLLESNQENS